MRGGGKEREREKVRERELYIHKSFYIFALQVAVIQVYYISRENR